MKSILPSATIMLCVLIPGLFLISASTIYIRTYLGKTEFERNYYLSKAKTYADRLYDEDREMTPDESIACVRIVIGLCQKGRLHERDLNYRRKFEIALQSLGSNMVRRSAIRQAISIIDPSYENGNSAATNFRNLTNIVRRGYITFPELGCSEELLLKRVKESVMKNTVSF